MPRRTKVLGAEHDATVFAALSAVLRQRGARLESRGGGHAGSQEVSQWRATIDGARIEIEAETYVGLCIRGPELLVEAIASDVAAALEGP